VLAVHRNQSRVYSGLERISESLELPISEAAGLIANRLINRAHNLHITTVVITTIRPGVWHCLLGFMIGNDVVLLGAWALWSGRVLDNRLIITYIFNATITDPKGKQVTSPPLRLDIIHFQS